ncbi:MAG: hypothetical protein U9N61_10890 [Euryarchaeota archaeon]|nr:hypothetical protein [Euryarchaeota archaeon]
MYQCSCKKCGHKWEADEPPAKCPRCETMGSQNIGFAFVADASADSPTEAAATSTLEVGSEAGAEVEKAPGPELSVASEPDAPTDEEKS